MTGFYAEEKTIQAMIDEFSSKFTEKEKSKLSSDFLDLKESDFEMLGYVVYYVDEDQFLTKNDKPKHPDDLEFNGMQEWAKEFETPQQAIAIAKSITDNHDVEMQVCKHISGINGKYLSLFNPVWSNKPMDPEEIGEPVLTE